MTPEEKAEKLVDEFSSYADYNADVCFNEREKMIINAKHCAIILANEMIYELSDLPRIPYNERREKYWKEVKNEIDKLKIKPKPHQKPLSSGFFRVTSFDIYIGLFYPKQREWPK